MQFQIWHWRSFIWFNFCSRCKTAAHLHPFARGCPVFPAPFVRETIPFCWVFLTYDHLLLKWNAKISGFSFFSLPLWFYLARSPNYYSLYFGLDSCHLPWRFLSFMKLLPSRAYLWNRLSMSKQALPVDLIFAPSHWGPTKEQNWTDDRVSLLSEWRWW